jgi:hypothetical protein
MKKPLSKLNKVELRDVWGHEALDFTTWLAQEDNLDLLSEEIGIDLKLLQTEAGVGKFSVDILAEEESSGRKIIIENQLENSNYEHLGKIITYASGYDAEIVIWIVKGVRDEHQKAIEWLNDHTDENISFFLIKLELWQIEGSNPAPKFEIIESPNEWAKVIKTAPRNDTLTNTKLQQLEYWNKFKDYVRGADTNIRLQTPHPQHWYNLTIGSSLAHISLTINSKDNSVGCEIYISRNKDLFQYLFERKEEIEREIRQSPIWFEPPPHPDIEMEPQHSIEWIEASVASRIKAKQQFTDVLYAVTWQDQFRWLYFNMCLFKEVFPKYIKDFKK